MMGSTAAHPNRAPAAFVPHGGGPLPLLNDPNSESLVAFMSSLAPSLTLLDGSPPNAILLVTAHWEEPFPTLSNNTTHDLLYDYYGFPPESYNIKYPGKGHPELAAKAAQLIDDEFGEGTARRDDRRGWDHGVFVPLKLIYPEANIPIVQMSVLRSLDPIAHIRLGAALEPLRDEGVAIVGSGMSFHNMRLFFSEAPKSWDGSDFNQALVDACTQVSPEERKKRFVAWEYMPGARASHPREEHLMPLLVVAGAAGRDRGDHIFEGDMLGYKISGFIFK
ncbi:hypothetical protein HK102_001387 [Quaeritorhiza haematococci]|nr:hypothetical protein HK102_001387 [Quaeritorhiza haematococci]